jgi:predicted nucleic acid-binding Zn ribbon protein
MRKHGSGLRRIGADLKETLRTLEIEGPAREAMAVALWPEVVGETIAAATRAVAVRGGVLEIRARSDSWRQEISFQKATILRRLNSRLGGNVLTDFRCRVDVVPRPASAAARQDIPAQEVAAIAVPAEVEERISSAARHRDPDIEAVLRRTLTREWQLDEWRRRHGYQPCVDCQALCEPPRTRCPACAAKRREQ